MAPEPTSLIILGSGYILLQLFLRSSPQPLQILTQLLQMLGSSESSVFTMTDQTNMGRVEKKDEPTRIQGCFPGSLRETQTETGMWDGESL